MANMNMESVNMFPRSIVFGNIRNMSSIKMLIRKGYLLAGVIMAANMFVVNEVKAMNTSDEGDTYQSDMGHATNDTEKKNSFLCVLDTTSWCVLYLENTINLAGGLVFSCVNNYFKWWNHNPGRYKEFGCFGWRSGRLIKDIFQIDINLNIGRGSLWLIATLIGSYEFLRNKEDVKNLKSTVALIMNAYKKKVWVSYSEKNSNYPVVGWIFFFFLSSVQGFISAPLAIHISNFSIAISLDSILWASVGKFLSLVDGTEKEENKNEK